MSESEPGVTSNSLLALLAVEEMERLRPHLRHATMTQGETIFEAGEPATSVFFPVSGVVSVVCTSAQGLSVEIGMVGYEGVGGALYLPRGRGTG